MYPFYKIFGEDLIYGYYLFLLSRRENKPMEYYK